MSNVYCCVNKKNELISSEFDTSSYLVCREWETLHKFQKESILIAWTDSGQTATHVLIEEDLVLLIGNLLPRDNAKDMLRRLYENVTTENYQDLLAEMDGRYSLFLVKNGILFVTVDILNSTRLYHYDNEEKFAYSTSMKSLAKAFNLGLNHEGIKQKFIFYTNYLSNLINGINFVSYDTASWHKIGTNSKGGTTSLRRLIYSTECSTTSYKEAANKLQLLIEKSIHDLNINDGVALSLSGGRDSRLTLAELAKKIGKEKVKAITVGSKREIEGLLATIVCKIFKINHQTLQIKRATPRDLESFVWDLEDFDPGAITHTRLMNALHKAQYPVVESTSPEILLGHIEKGQGKDSYPINFLHNRSKKHAYQMVLDSDNTIKKAMNEVNLIWDDLPHENAWYKNIRLLDFLYFQVRWTFWMLKLYDIAGGVLPLYTNRSVFNFCMNLPLNQVDSYSLYDFLCHNNLKSWFIVYTTRDLAKDINSEKSLLKTVGRKMFGKVYSWIGQEYFSVKTLRLSSYDFSEYLKENRNILEEIFQESSIQEVIGDLESAVDSETAPMKRYDDAIIFSCIVAFMKIIRGQIDNRRTPQRVINV